MFLLQPWHVSLYLVLAAISRYTREQCLVHSTTVLMAAYTWCRGWEGDRVWVTQKRGVAWGMSWASSWCTSTGPLLPWPWCSRRGRGNRLALEWEGWVVPFRDFLCIILFLIFKTKRLIPLIPRWIWSFILEKQILEKQIFYFLIFYSNTKYNITTNKNSYKIPYTHSINK